MLREKYFMPQCMTDIKEVEVCYKIAAKMAELFYENLDRISKEKDTDTASEETIRRKEKMYGLERYVGLSLSDRRFRLKLYENSIVIMNYSTLEKIMHDLAGDAIILERDLDAHKITAKVSLTSLKQVYLIAEFLRAYIPVWFNCEINVLYNDFNTFSSKTWTELSEKTFKELKEAVINGDTAERKLKFNA